MGLPNIGPLELIIILAIALLIVGPGRLPEMGNAIGRTIREFRKASSDITGSDSKEQPEPNQLSGASAPNTNTVTESAASGPAGSGATAPKNVTPDETRTEDPKTEAAERA